MTKIDAAYLRFLGCILATSPEEFYRNYPRNGRHFNAKGKNEYWNRMLGNDKDYNRKRYAAIKARKEAAK